MKVLLSMKALSLLSVACRWPETYEVLGISSAVEGWARCGKAGTPASGRLSP